MKCKLIELITRSRAKPKLVLLQFFFNGRNVSNVKPLWLMCDLMQLPSNGDGLSDFLKLIHLG
jgi:hypothetical protein